MSEIEKKDRAEYLKNSPLMETTPLKEIFQHFGIEDNPEQPKYFCALFNNRALTRKQFELIYRLQGRKRVVIDYDPDYFCFAVSEIPFADIIQSEQ